MSLWTLTTNEFISGTQGDKPNNVWSDLKHVKTYECIGNADLVAQKTPMSVFWR